MNYTDWKQVRLVDLALINAKSISGKYPYEEIEYIDTSSVTGNEFSPLQRLKLIDAPSRAKRIVQHGDTILSTVRPIQRHFGFIRNPKPNTIASTGFAVITPKNINPEFLFYYLSQESITNYLNGIAETSTTTFPAFRPEVLSDLELVIPSDEKVQRRIADILSALDDKIELNRQTNATLEAIAQAIFKKWFVNFNFPGATGEMMESELGLIPHGWRIGKLGEICEFAYGKGLKSEIRVEGKYPVVGSNGIVGTHNDYLAEGPGIVIGRKGTIGEVTWVHQNFFPIDTTFYINDLLGVNDLYFHYFLLKEQDFKKIGSDSAVPGLNRNQAYVSLVVIPAKDVINQFNDITQAIFADIYNYSNESSTLATIRDTLLPKLMNGEIE